MRVAITVRHAALVLALVLALCFGGPAAFAAPIDVQVWGRAYHLDPRPDPEDPDTRQLATLRGAIPPDLASPPGFQPTDEQVLAEVEERMWIAQFRQEDAFNALLAAQMHKNPRTDEFAFIDSFNEGRGGVTSPEVQKLTDTHMALHLLARGLRRSMGVPERPAAGFHFTLPRLPAEVVASYRKQGFNPSNAYAGFRAVKAAFRSGDVALVARVSDFPLTVGGRMSVRNAAELAAAKDIVMRPAVRDIVARQAFNDLFVRDQGAMFGNGEVWISPGRVADGLFKLQTVNAP